MRLSTVKVLIGLFRGDYRPDPESPAAPDHRQDPHAPLPPGQDGRTRPLSRPRKRKARAYIWTLAFLVTVYFVVPYLLHALVNPWAISLTGKPTLPGYWQGQAPFARGDVRRVVMHLVSEPRAGRCNRCSSITGEVKVCTGGRAGLYEFTGDAKDRSASRFYLGVTPGDAPGRYLREINGQWAGGDQIGITATLMVRDPDGVTRSDHQPTKPVHFTMRRVTEADFTAAC